MDHRRSSRRWEQVALSRSTFVAALLGRFLLSAPLAAQEPDTPAALALVNATVIDGTGAPPRPAMTIVIRDGVIEAVHPTGSRSLPPDVRIEDVGGRFVIPGLIDAHVHIGLGSLDAQLRALRLQLRGGVTTVRDPSGDSRITGYLSRQALIGAIEAPDVFYAALMGGPGFGAYGPVAGVSVGWEPGTAPWAREVTADSDVARVIAEARGTGATGIKMYRYLPPQLATALATEAHRQGMRVWSHTRIRGHTGTGEPSSQPGEVVAAGADVLSHANHFACEVMACATGEERSRAVSTVDPAHPDILSILRAMAERGAILDPTLLNTVTSPSYQDQPQWLRFAGAVTRLAHEAGVAIAAGTDVPMPVDDGSLPRLHDELELLVDHAGLTPAEAIVAATRTAARAIGQQTVRGTIEAGRRADLVVLRGDPTVDIRNTRTIERVIKAGRVVETSTASAAASPPSSSPANLASDTIHVTPPTGAKDAGREASEPAGVSVAVGPAAQPDTAEVMAAAEAFLTAFNNLDWDAFHASFAPSATVFQPFGEPGRNNDREEVAAFFGSFFDQIRSSTEGPPYMHITPRDLRIEMLDAAGIVTFHLPGEESVGRRTLVFGRKGSTDPWRLFHLHASSLERPESLDGGDTADRNLDPEAVRRYVGLYALQSDEGLRMTVVFRSVDGGLEARLGGYARALRYLGGHTFQEVESGFIFVFNVEQDGLATGITGLPPELDRVEVFDRVGGS